MSFSGKVALITGAGGGIGRAVSKSFARERAKIFLTDSRETSVEQVKKEIVEGGGLASSARMDVTSADDVAMGVQHCLDEYSRVDILVNCAGILTILPFDMISEEIWDRTMDVNARGTFLTCQRVAQQMIRQGNGGKIINVSSVAGKIGAPYYTHYCASKFAVLGITKSLALELAKHRVHVNAVCPGDVETEMLEYEFRTHAQMKGLSVGEVKKQLADRVPLGRLATPDDVADVILFLASEKADYMTGQAINVSGGTVMF